jgi:hypothetical protein
MIWDQSSHSSHKPSHPDRPFHHLDSEGGLGVTQLVYVTANSHLGRLTRTSSIPDANLTRKKLYSGKIPTLERHHRFSEGRENVSQRLQETLVCFLLTYSFIHP